MTIRELIYNLEDLAEEVGDDTIVRIATQPSWPLAERIVCVSAQEHDEERERPVVWIAVDAVYSHEHPYAPRGAWDGEYME